MRFRTTIQQSGETARAKTHETRQRRIAKSVDMLREGRAR